MKAKQIIERIEELVSPSLAYEGDEPAIIVGSQDMDINFIGVTWRPTIEVLKQATEAGVDMLIIHEPLYQSEKAFIIDSNELDWAPNKERREIVEKGNFIVYRIHSPLDDSEPGQNTVLADILEIKVTQKLPYGRLGMIDTIKLGDFVDFVKKKLGCPHVLVVGDEGKQVEKVAVVAGGGNSLVDMLENAKLQGADVFVSGDIQDSRARYANELGLAVIDAGGYYTENPGAKAFAHRLDNEFIDIKVSYFDPGPPWKNL